EARRGPRDPRRARRRSGPSRRVARGPCDRRTADRRARIIDQPGSALALRSGRGTLSGVRPGHPPRADPGPRQDSEGRLSRLPGAIHFNRIGLGMILILAFGCGMAATLVTVGLALVGARRVAQDVAGPYLSVGRAVHLVPELAALVVVLFGVAMTAQGLVTIF